MKFIDFLKSIEEFDGEIITNCGLESQYSFVWSKGQFEITDAGKIKFNDIFYSEIMIRNNVIIIQSEIDNELFDLFMATQAGYVSCKLFDKWFKELPDEPAKEAGL